MRPLSDGPQVWGILFSGEYTTCIKENGVSPCLNTVKAVTYCAWIVLQGPSIAYEAIIFVGKLLDICNYLVDRGPIENRPFHLFGLFVSGSQICKLGHGSDKLDRAAIQNEIGACRFIVAFNQRIQVGQRKTEGLSGDECECYVPPIGQEEVSISTTSSNIGVVERPTKRKRQLVLERAHCFDRTLGRWRHLIFFELRQDGRPSYREQIVSTDRINTMTTLFVMVTYIEADKDEEGVKQ